MNTKEQKVETYSDLYYAKCNIERNIKDGWFVHTCVSYHNNDINNDTDNGILVIYEKNYETWN